MELWDAYTREEKRVDTVLVRGEPIPTGLYHLACGVFVRHVDGSILCMKRARAKASYPGRYDVSAGGAALRGETKYDCVKRELKEETGITCEVFQQIGRHVSEKSHIILYNFLCTVDCPKDSITLQEGETEGYVWMSEEEFIHFLNSGGMIDWQRAQYHDYMVSMGWLKDRRKV